MTLHPILPKELDRVKEIVVQFIRRYGDNRITHHAIRWFQHLRPSSLGDGTLVTLSLNQKKITGVIVFGNYGIDESFVVIHPKHREQRIGEALLTHSLEKLPKIYTRVACDNIPSLKLCFHCGLIAFKLFQGPTGKPTLWLGGGQWLKEDIEVSQEINRKKG